MKSWPRAKLWVFLSAFGSGLLLFGLSSCGNTTPPGGNGGGGGSGGGGGGSPGFSMALNPSQLTATAGDSATTTLTITPQNGFSGTVNLSLIQQDGSPAPSSLTLSPTQVSVSGTTSKTLQISVGSGVAPGTYRLRLAGRSGSLKAQADFTLEVSSGGGGAATRAAIGPVERDRSMTSPTATVPSSPWDTAAPSSPPLMA